MNASIVPNASILGNFSALNIVNLSYLYYFLIEGGIITTASEFSTPPSSTKETYSSP
jgi:hypothetical protein